jgi:hypothetical protein
MALMRIALAEIITTGVTAAAIAAMVVSVAPCAGFTCIFEVYAKQGS